MARTQATTFPAPRTTSSADPLLGKKLGLPSSEAQRHAHTPRRRHADCWSRADSHRPRVSVAQTPGPGVGSVQHCEPFIVGSRNICLARRWDTSAGKEVPVTLLRGNSAEAQIGRLIALPSGLHLSSELSLVVDTFDYVELEQLDCLRRRMPDLRHA
jgi:hypothetical protein